MRQTLSRATKISFINDCYLCEKIGCDVHDVARAILCDRRIGGKFLHQAGARFPFKDTQALTSVARQFNCIVNVMQSLRRIVASSEQ
jgi:UDPglucose 6-dehydrogenase